MVRRTLIPSYLPPLPTLQELIRDYKLKAKKSFSQNYLFNKAAIAKLVASAGNLDGKHVVEVGPGPGGITREILNYDIKHLSLVENDRRFRPILQSLASAYSEVDKSITVYEGDILNFNMESLFPDEVKREWDDEEPPACIIGNLPFNISTPLITRWLHDMSERRGAWSIGRVPLVLTFQKEVGERMEADILHRQRSRLSVTCQYLCDVKMEYIIKGKVFVPAPLVDAAVMKFVPRKEPLINQPYPLVNKVIKHVFHYRQKYCKAGILTLFPSSLSHLAVEMLQRAEVDPTTRPVQLTIEDFSRLCDSYSVLCQQYPELLAYEYRVKKSVEKFELLYPEKDPEQSTEPNRGIS